MARCAASARLDRMPRFVRHRFALVDPVDRRTYLATGLGLMAFDGGKVMKRALVAGVMVAGLLASPMAHSGAAGQAKCGSRAAVPVPPAYASTVARGRALVGEKLAGPVSGPQGGGGGGGTPGGVG